MRDYNYDIISKSFHKELFDNLNELLNNSLQGIWSIYYIKGANILKTLDTFFIIELDESLYKTIQNTTVNVGFSSVGWAFSEFKKDINKNIIFIDDTYSDPRGTVITLDYYVNQKNIGLYAIRDKNNDVVGIFDFFSNINIKEKQTEIETKLNEYNDLLLLLINNQLQLEIHSIFKSISVSTNIYDLLKDTLNNFLQLNNHLFIPFIYIEENGNIKNSNSIALSEYILERIEYELIFCSYLNSKSQNCYFTDKLCGCAAKKKTFLEIFYFNIVPKFECIEIFIENKFQISFYFFRIFDIDKNEISKLFENINNYHIPKEFYNVAYDKFENELIVKKIKKIIDDNKDEYFLRNLAFYIIYKDEANVPAICINDCLRNDISYYRIISPSNFFPYYYNEKYNIKFTDTYRTSFLFPEKLITWIKVEKATHILSVNWVGSIYVEILKEYIFNDFNNLKNEIQKIEPELNLEKKIHLDNFKNIVIYGIDKDLLNENYIAKTFFETLLKNYLLDVEKNKALYKSLQATISNIINRNTAHHLISHVSPRTTIDEILKRLGFKNAKALQTDKENNKHHFFDFDSIFEMQNRYLKYVSDREEYVAGLDNNTQPVKLSFYKDIIMPFIENCLFIDNIAASEGISFANSPENKEVVSSTGISKLRIRVFYKDNIFNTQKDKKNLCAKEIHHFECSEDCKIKKAHHELEYSDLELEGYTEMVAHYPGIQFLENNQIKKKDCCIHELPFYRKLNESGAFYVGDKIKNDGIEFTCDDIEILARGTQSAHILYSMLENHIRNTAKHAPREIIEKAEHVDIIIKVSPRENDNYSYNLEITTNIPTFTEIVKSEKDARLPENEDNLFAKLIRNATDDIDESTSSLGLADMRINSNFLRFGEISQNNLKDSLKIGYVEKQNKKGLFSKPDSKKDKFKFAIKYSCELQKPRTVAFIGFDDINENSKEQLVSEGCSFFSGFDKETSKFTFNIIHSKVLNDSKDFLKEWIYKVPRRSFVIGNRNEIKDIAQFPNRFQIIPALSKDFFSNPKTNLLEWCWQNWLKKWTGEEKRIYLSIVPDRVNDEEVYLDENFSDDIFSNTHSDFNIDISRHSWALPAHYISGAKYNTPEWFHEGIEKNNKDFDYIWGVYQKYRYTQQLDSIVKYDLAETGLLKILVLDERITELCNFSEVGNTINDMKNFGFGFEVKNPVVKFIEIAMAANICIATSINGHPIKGYDYSLNYDFQFGRGKGIKLISNNPVDIHLNPEESEIDLMKHFKFDVLIIHRTYLEEIVKTPSINFEDLSKLFSMIYISTGGGNIKEVEKKCNTSFNLIALHSLKKYLNRIVMKHSLKQILT